MIKKIIGTVLWDLSERLGFSLGRYAPMIFGWKIGCKAVRVRPDKDGDE